MKRIIYICDICGKQTEEPIEAMKGFEPYNDICFCTDCLDFVLGRGRHEKKEEEAPELIPDEEPCESVPESEQPVTEPVMEKPEKEQPESKETVSKKPAKKKAGAKPRVDRGRILALHNNGWSVAKIADDMGCAQQTVRNALKELTDHDND